MFLSFIQHPTVHSTVTLSHWCLEAFVMVKCIFYFSSWRYFMCMFTFHSYFIKSVTIIIIMEDPSSVFSLSVVHIGLNLLWYQSSWRNAAYLDNLTFQLAFWDRRHASWTGWSLEVKTLNAVIIKSSIYLAVFPDAIINSVMWAQLQWFLCLPATARVFFILFLNQYFYKETTQLYAKGCRELLFSCHQVDVWHTKPGLTTC